MFGNRFTPVQRHDKVLAVATQLASQIREAVLKETDYTCSAGIAHNKMLAKMASGQNKPNGQTIIPESQVELAMGAMPVGKIKFAIRCDLLPI